MDETPTHSVSLTAAAAVATVSIGGCGRPQYSSARREAVTSAGLLDNWNHRSVCPFKPFDRNHKASQVAAGTATIIRPYIKQRRRKRPNKNDRCCCCCCCCCRLYQKKKKMKGASVHHHCHTSVTSRHAMPRHAIISNGCPFQVNGSCSSSLAMAVACIIQAIGNDRPTDRPTDRVRLRRRKKERKKERC